MIIKLEAIYKITSPKGESKSVSLGLRPGFELCKTNPIRESSIKNRASRICKTNPILPTTFLHIYFKTMRNLLQSFEKIAKNPRLLQIFDINTLNSIYNKDLHNFLSRSTLQPARYASLFTRYEIMQNEPNLTQKRT
jgi:hypothetical protein